MLPIYLIRGLVIPVDVCVKAVELAFFFFSCDIENLSSFQSVCALRPLESLNTSALCFAFEEIPPLLVCFLQRSLQGGFSEVSHYSEVFPLK